MFGAAEPLSQPFFPQISYCTLFSCASSSSVKERQNVVVCVLVYVHVECIRGGFITHTHRFEGLHLRHQLRQKGRRILDPVHPRLAGVQLHPLVPPFGERQGLALRGGAVQNSVGFGARAGATHRDWHLPLARWRRAVL